MNESPYILRTMRPEDIDQVHAIDQASFSMPWPRSSYQFELYENQHSRLWVAETDGENRRVVGMIVVWLIMDEAHIATLAVHPDYRQQGIARCLLITALRQVIQEGASLATLEVRAGNLIAQRLYQHFGFEIVGRRARYYRDNNEDAIIMTVDKLGPAYIATRLEQEHATYCP